MPNQDEESGDVALGFRAHSGWAAIVALRQPIAAPLVVMRRRLKLIDSNGVAQPYHAAEKMPLEEARAFPTACTETCEAIANDAIRTAAADLNVRGYRVIKACQLTGSGRTGVPLESILASHALIHTAEGDFYRNAILTACEAHRIPLYPIKEKQVWQIAGTALSQSRDELENRIQELGKWIGPPWRQDEKLCALAAWISMAT